MTRHIDRWNRTDSPEINPYIDDQLVFNKVAKTTQWRKNSLQQLVLGQLDNYVQKIEFDP